MSLAALATAGIMAPCKSCMTCGALGPSLTDGGGLRRSKRRADKDWQAKVVLLIVGKRGNEKKNAHGERWECLEGCKTPARVENKRRLDQVGSMTMAW